MIQCKARSGTVPYKHVEACYPSVQITAELHVEVSSAKTVNPFTSQVKVIIVCVYVIVTTPDE